MTHVHLEPATPAVRSTAGSLLGDLARFAALIALTLALVVGALIGLGAPSEAAPTASRDVLRSSVVTLTNVARVAAGCRPLKMNSKLTRAAQAHANDMAQKRYLQHNSADGTIWWKQIEKYGYKDPGGQNIARGFSGATSVMKAWLASPGHRKNIRNCQFRTIGVGFNGNGGYWVQDFGY